MTTETGKQKAVPTRARRGKRIIFPLVSGIAAVLATAILTLSVLGVLTIAGVVVMSGGIEQMVENHRRHENSTRPLPGDEDDGDTEKETTVLFGSYPQTEVTDSSLTDVLTSLAGTLPTSENSYAWTSYGYYAKGEVSNYMWYINVTYSGETYRGVYFTHYRPYYTDYISSTANTYQDDNGYYTSNIYWFKFEPILWRIVAEANGEAILVCEMLIDSHEFDDSNSYSNNYANSNIRAWLNESFYETAFSASEQEQIVKTWVDNSAESTGYADNSDACEDTYDNVFLLSYEEVTGYFTSNGKREKQTTDYAQCQGAYTYSDGSYEGNGWWWLRSPSYSSSYYARFVFYGGIADNYSVDSTDYGVCPALRICL